MDKADFVGLAPLYYAIAIREYFRSAKSGYQGTASRDVLAREFTITDEGKAVAEGKDKPTDPKPKDREAGVAVIPASNPSSSERTANTDIQCPKCHTFNPFHAEFCKQCGTVLRQRAETVLKAAPRPQLPNPLFPTAFHQTLRGT